MTTNPEELDDDQIDGCEIDFTDGKIISDEEIDMQVLFAEALDPNSPKTIFEAAAEWEALFPDKRPFETFEWVEDK